MRKFSICLLAVAVAVSLAACSTREEQEQASERPDASSSSGSDTGDSEPPPDPGSPAGEVARLMEGARGWNTQVLDSYLPGEATVEQYVPAALQDTVSKALSRMTYEIDSTYIDDNSARVEMEITAVDVESAMNEAVVGVISYITKQQLTGKSIDNYTEIAKAASDAVNIDKLPTTTTLATAYLIREEEGEWQLDLGDERNAGLLNAVSGGTMDIVDRIKELADTYGLNLSK